MASLVVRCYLLGTGKGIRERISELRIFFNVEAEVGKIRIQQNLKDVLGEHGFGIS